MNARIFPGLTPQPLSRRLTYMDNACMTPPPQPVVDAVTEFYRSSPGCPLRSLANATNHLETRIHEGRDLVRSWLGARFSDEIVFTLNTTMSINLIAGAFSRVSGAVLLCDSEHNSNRLPWLEQEIVELNWQPGTDFPFDEYRRLLTRGIKLVSIASVSNVTGSYIPVREVVSEAHAQGILIHIDAAQQAMHNAIDITENGPDLLSLSLHKAYGPSGLGVLYMSRELHRQIRPILAGGGSVDGHHEQEVTYTSGAARFEYGLQNYAAQYAVCATIKFLTQFSAKEVQNHFQHLNTLARQLLNDISGIRFIGSRDPTKCNHICNFYIENIDSLRITELLNLVGNIQVRGGQMCAHHYYHRYKLPPSIRMSFGYHNTDKEVQYYVQTLRTILEHYL